MDDRDSEGCRRSSFPNLDYQKSNMYVWRLDRGRRLLSDAARHFLKLPGPIIHCDQ